MRLALIARTQRVDLEAAAPPRDRTSRTTKNPGASLKSEWTRAYDLAQEKGQPAAKALRMAQVAYKLAMPRMESLPSIRAYIAAIAQGILHLEVFDGRDGSQLLYAAQVALGTLRQKGAKKP